MPCLELFQLKMNSARESHVFGMENALKSIVRSESEKHSLFWLVRSSKGTPVSLSSVVFSFN